MIYEIQSKSDFLTGASLSVRIPEYELDAKALHTIAADKPDFILPFRHRRIDGQVEFVYQIGPNSKLQYLSGGRSPKEYAELWSGVLRPLLDCGDWFMKPYSFVLSAAYLYCDKNKKIVSYVYIPSVRDCSNYDALKEMAAEISKTITVADAELENKVLRAIMKEFSPKGFLQMLKSYMETSAPVVKPHCPPEPWQTAAGAESQARAPIPHVTVPEQSAHPQPFGCAALTQVESGTQKPAQSMPGDIVISMPTERVSEKKIIIPPKNKESSGVKKEKEAGKPKNPGGLFSRKKAGQGEEKPAVLSQPHPVREPVVPAQDQFVPAPAPYAVAADISDDTQSFSEAAGGARFRLVGSVLLPPIIDVSTGEGEVFTVGRFDAATGKQQSSFEFDKKTKAVSRRHAVIERDSDGYSIVDLASSAGTFVNGQKLPPNTPFQLKNGSRVSFGNAGADYVWEG